MAIKSYDCRSLFSKGTVLRAQGRICFFAKERRVHSLWRWTTIDSLPDLRNTANVELLPALQSSVAKLKTRGLINRFQIRLFSLVELFNAFACDCLEKQDSCFSSRISAPAGDFLVNPKLHAVYNGIYLDPQRQRSVQIFNLTVNMISAANFLANDTNAFSRNLVQ